MINQIKNLPIIFCFVIITLMAFSCDGSKAKEEITKVQDSREKEVLVQESALSADSLINFTNIEQIEYCLPIPLNDYTEDFDQNNVKAKHIFKHKTKKDNEIKIQGLFREDPSVSIEDYFKKRFESSEEQGEIVEKKELLKDKNCFYAKGYMSNLIDKYKFIELVWLRKDEVVVYSSTYDIADTSLWDQRLEFLLRSTASCN